MTIKNTLFIGKVFLDFPELDSTNSYATELIAKSKPTEGTAISTFQQTLGRGQIGSSWESEPHKNIALSVILYPTFLPLREQFVLNLAVSLAVRDFVAKYIEKPVKVKWPNDIYVENRKVVGILIQNSIGQSAIQSSVIGIGVNVNQTQFSAAAPNATSFALEAGQSFDLYQLIEQLCVSLEQRYLKLKNSTHYHALRAEYLSQLYRFDEPAQFRRADGSTFYGKIIDIAASGKLVIASDQGQEEFAIKEISFA